MKYDQEEQEILAAYHTGDMSLSKPPQREIDAIKAAVSQTFKKDKRNVGGLLVCSFRYMNS